MAAKALLHHWPEAHHEGRACKAAKRACVDVHDGKKPIETLRKALIAAAEDAGILRKDTMPSG